ncbi:hypothetical protein OIU78_029929 [Salix suchowensis]|nr:hypothetical protein OIU78_029929 [Salix suchowensis]
MWWLCHRKKKDGDHVVVDRGCRVDRGCWWRWGLQQSCSLAISRSQELFLKNSVEINPLSTLLHKPSGLFMRCHHCYARTALSKHSISLKPIAPTSFDCERYFQEKSTIMARFPPFKTHLFDNPSLA